MTRFYIMQISVHEAKAKFSRLIATVESGGEVVVARHRKPVARILPITERKLSRIGGLANRPFHFGSNFDDPSLSEILADEFGVTKG